ncbi:hypothetical protein [Halorhodospira halophila]|uniref:hypothetical protein n=1 Tax=Halorhodospira halophila TaxID=1053 RepID=UPI00191195E1|nr:hypothetical protein [Halorhodospira halophila]MBK5935782.1 hypothetical protein [Halorhodospira halophila]
MHRVSASDRLTGVLAEGAEAHAPEPAGALRRVLGCAGAGGEAVYVLIHVRSGFLTGVPHAWGPPREVIRRRLAACVRMSPPAAARMEETVSFDRQAPLLPEPVRRRMELGLDAAQAPVCREQRLRRLAELNRIALTAGGDETPEQAWRAMLERVAAAPAAQAWWQRWGARALLSRLGA